MTLLDFELHMRPAKVTKARDMYRKGQVLELRPAAVMWVARMKIGLYKVHIDVDDLKVNRSTCTCDARRTSYCEHAVATLFAIRKELGLKPILASTVPQLPRTNNRLTDLIKSFNAIDHEISKTDVTTFTSTIKQMLKAMELAFNQQDYQTVAGLGVAVVTALQDMDEYMQYNYTACETCAYEAFEWLEKLYTVDMPEDLQAVLFHDMRIEAVRRYQTISGAEKNWLTLLMAGANNAIRQDQFTRTMNALCVLVNSSENEYAQNSYVKQFTLYRDRLSTS